MWRGSLDLTLREATVLARRLGIHGRRETYREIGMTLEVSMERARQIQAKAIRVLRYRAEWIGTLDTKVKELREKLGRPLSLHEAQELDPWFDRVAEYSYVFERILDISGVYNVHVIEIDSVQYFASITRREWKQILSEGMKISSRFRSNEITTDHYLELIPNLLPECAQEFTEILWKSVHRRRHY